MSNPTYQYSNDPQKVPASTQQAPILGYPTQGYPASAPAGAPTYPAPQAGYPAPQGYPPQQAAPIGYPPAYAHLPGFVPYPNPTLLPIPAPGTWGIGMEEFQRRYQVSPKWTPYLTPLPNFTTVIICDDSGSMANLADPDTYNGLTRWDELKMAMNIVIEAHAAVGTVCDVYFINRGAYRNVSSMSQLAAAFSHPPHGGTNTLLCLHRVAIDHFNADAMEKKVIVHLFTDGHPTDFHGREDFPSFVYWLSNRPCMQSTFISIILCTDDEYVDRQYRRLEYNPGFNQGIAGVDFTMDYRGECVDIRRTRGWSYPFTFGDYVVKTIAGAYDPSIHLLDLPAASQLCCTIS
ncbi:hypothetical protein CEUSTIGMA_g5673.t1 [Chlamydomonas eustigma]|uniref:VWFA domain-containing protein n=1 Tax=Chlamydomonas eustigma TaxID=1157962 RepID=A0A250X577_9CHLO|nr:hypothetical protein CEUSTIGMA_g5673.t1 [Chlamydomonas eustigma]|eukprot:GAX78231.1 hypothetical protein CEUSTIGMA_g5673.t1 [Chlamydomonas eustigma]